LFVLDFPALKGDIEIEAPQITHRPDADARSRRARDEQDRAGRHRLGHISMSPITSPAS
jgi:hypothetical protein